jgi:AcrR family transcriptional regulator
MPGASPVDARILDAAAELIVRDGFHSLTIERVAEAASTTPEVIIDEFGSLDEALVLMLNREFTGIYLMLVDNVERDPQGGLLSRIYFYTLAAVYERPLARILYTVDREAMGSIMRSANSFGYVPGVGIRADFIENMQRAGMVQRDVDAQTVSHMLTIFSAGLALTAPHEELDRIVRGVTDLMARAVDTDAVDTTPGKVAFYEWATSLVHTGS